MIGVIQSLIELPLGVVCRPRPFLELEDWEEETNIRTKVVNMGMIVIPR